MRLTNWRLHRNAEAAAKIHQALQPVTAKEVRDLMLIGLKSDEELDSDFPATGENNLPAPALASRTADMTPRPSGEAVSEARESDNSATDGSRSDSRGGQNLSAIACDGWSDVWDEVSRRFFKTT